MTRVFLFALATFLLIDVSSLAAQSIPAVRLSVPRSLPGNLPPEIDAQLQEKLAQSQGQTTATPSPSTPNSGSTSATSDQEAAARQKKLEARLKKLDKVKFNRLPSHVLEVWGKGDYLTEKERELSADLPPVPPQAIFENDERFNIALKKLQYDVTIGNWEAVQSFLDLVPEKTAPAAKAGATSAGGSAAGGGGARTIMRPVVETRTIVDPSGVARTVQVTRMVAETVTTPPVNSTKPPTGKTDEGTEDDKKKFPVAMKLYRKILQSLSGSLDRSHPANKTSNRNLDSRAFQATFLTYADVMAIAQMSPEELSASDISQFGRIFRIVVSRNGNKTDMLNLLSKDLEAKEPTFKKRDVAKILFAAGNPIDAGDFLPEFEVAKKEKDFEALNLLSNHLLAVHRKSRSTPDLDKAWNVTQAILDSEKVEDKERKQALERALSLSKQISKELRNEWLEKSFKTSPERGVELLSAIGTGVAKSLVQSSSSPQTRLAALQLQNDAVNALYESKPEDLGPWNQALELMAINWLREANISYTDDEKGRRGNQVNRDIYGNVYFVNDYYYNQRRTSPYRISPIALADVIKLIPRLEWLSQLSDTLKPKFDMVQAQLYLKVSEESNALPFIEKIAKTYPEETEKLANECLSVWTENHNPNLARQRNSQYMFYYAYETRAESIPLTRSKQVRYLEELSELIPKLNRIIDNKLDQDKILEAFMACHSVAEVYTVEEIEKVFGKIDEVEPKIFARLARRMRSNLATLWRASKTQKDSKTKRNKKELRAEVMRGYDVARKAIDDGLQRGPDNWDLIGVDAALIHDANNYATEEENSSKFVGTRLEAFKRFKQAADIYVSKLTEMEEKDYSTALFETWFYASLGACDVGLIDKKHQRDTKQTGLIKAVFDQMPEKARKWHEARFANLLFSRLRSVQAELKYRYLDAGFEIVGDHEQAEEAKEVHDYYKDLITEIKLHTELDGSDKVGQEPFGLFVSLKHTKQIERESGGFGRYLQNQNSNMSYSYNYGRPTSDYRDKFEEECRSILDEQFEILSLTFQDPGVKSEALPKDGWRETPYAYILLKARGPEIDQLPPLRISLDFLDTSGYVILPIESPTLVVDASTTPDPRPYENIEITQILDERQAEEGKLILEIKATASGLVPDLGEIMDVNATGFEVSNVDDQGVAVDQFDDEASEVCVKSSRNWLVSLKADADRLDSTKEELFTFPETKIETTDVVFQRYDDADLETVAASVNLNENYVKPSYTIWIVVGLAALLGFMLLVGGIVVLARGAGRHEQAQLEIPEQPTPFFVISMLKDICENNGLNENQKAEIGTSINRIEKYYFGQGEQNGDAPDLQSLVGKWKSKIRG